MISTHRSPLFKFILLLATWSSYLYSVAFAGYGRIDLEGTLESNKKTFGVWLSLVFVVSRNIMH
jgi:hypothetical protein